jgi:serine/threonine-protein kinase mTOR
MTFGTYSSVFHYANVSPFFRLVIQFRLYFAYVRHLWYTDRREESINRLTYLSDVVDMVSHCESIKDSTLRASCWIELGEWKLAQASTSSKAFIEEPMQLEVLTDFKRATLLPGCGYRAWHSWALLNFRIAIQLSEDDEDVNSAKHNPKPPTVLRNHVVAAVVGFVNAISQGTKKWSASVQQDLLNLLTCLFKFGNFQDVAKVINGSISSIAIEAWLGVIPQLLARIQIRDPSIRSVLHPLLTRLGEKHPQALMYPLSVLVKSSVAEQRVSAESLMNSLKNHSSELVEEALMVSSELIRVAILWLETWHEGLEDASRLCYGENNVAGMLELLLPLHSALEKGAATKLEHDFLQNFGQELEKAHEHLKEYIFHMNQSRNAGPTSRHSEEAEAAMRYVWGKLIFDAHLCAFSFLTFVIALFEDIYYTVFRRINKQLPSLTNLDLAQCSPSLSFARNLELGVPGSYRVDGTYVKIEKFVANVEVINSKQRPRKITLRGSDGQDYVFLLKGHEDLRQDDRVMQVFGLVNALLIRDPQTRKHDLKIQRYAISPLSHNCGVVGWVPHCDTLHSLIKDYRQAKKVPLNMENREMLKLAPDFDMLTVMQKVEVFVEALKKTTGKGNDLAEILWLKSSNSEEWLERRTKYTRSLAVMSMVGYILGLGDRHPSNLMLDKISGRILHIDFGDCFEVAMNRDKYPEQIPFRLTRMLIKAMEISGIEGSYRSTCERTMTVLRDNRDSLVAMLEAFVYDPLVSWRLADMSKVAAVKSTATSAEAGTTGLVHQHTTGSVAASVVRRGIPVESITEDPDEENDEKEFLTTNQLLATVRNIPSVPNGQAPYVGGSSRDQGKSLKIYEEMQAMAASVNADSRIASITGKRSEQVTEGSINRSRMARSMRQREFLSFVDGNNGTAREEALNEKALKIIRRVQDKLSGTDFPDCVDEPLVVPDQVQRLIVQATSSENLSQLYIGWCSFW